MIDHKHIGAETDEVSIVVERTQLRLFCQAVGKARPVFWGAVTARVAGHKAVPTPPTRILHGKQAFSPHDKALYRRGRKLETLFARLKDWRRIATPL